MNTEIDTNDNIDCDKGFEFDSIEEDIEKSQFFCNVKIQVDKHLANIKATIEDINKMRGFPEKVASLEKDLLARVDSSTWKDISALIGMSSDTIINDCFKILDLADDDVELPLKS